MNCISLTLSQMILPVLGDPHLERDHRVASQHMFHSASITYELQQLRLSAEHAP